jgi:hypothetical protein
MLRTEMSHQDRRMTNVTYPATLELMFVAKWLLSAPIETVEHDMGVARPWIEERLSLMASELAPGAYRTNAEVAKAYLYLKEDAPKRPGIVVPPGACDPTRWRDVLAASLGDQEVTPITQSQPGPLTANNGTPVDEPEPLAANDGAPMARIIPAPKPPEKARHQPGTLVAKVEAGLGAQAMTTTELGERVHLNRSSVLSALRELVAAGRAVAEGTRNRTRYRRTLESAAPHRELPAGPHTQETSMSITKTLEADLKRMQTEQQPTLMVQALRRRRDELTFADVLSILASPLGHGLASVQIRELFVGEASTRGARP